MNTPHLYRHIAIPDTFLTTAQWENQSLTFGGDIRMGDLTGDGTPDLLVYRCDALSELKPVFLKNGMVSLHSRQLLR